MIESTTLPPPTEPVPSAPSPPVERVRAAKSAALGAVVLTFPDGTDKELTPGRLASDPAAVAGDVERWARQWKLYETGK